MTFPRFTSQTTFVNRIGQDRPLSVRRFLWQLRLAVQFHRKGRERVRSSRRDRQMAGKEDARYPGTFRGAPLPDKQGKALDRDTALEPCNEVLFEGSGPCVVHIDLRFFPCKKSEKGIAAPSRISCCKGRGDLIANRFPEQLHHKFDRNRNTRFCAAQ